MCLLEGFRNGTITSVKDWENKSREAAEEVARSRAPVATPAAAELTPEFSTMTVVQLQAELRKRGLPVSGRKAVLLTRLQGAVATATL